MPHKQTFISILRIVNAAKALNQSTIINKRCTSFLKRYLETGAIDKSNNEFIKMQ